MFSVFDNCSPLQVIIT